MNKEPIYYINGGIKFTIHVKNDYYHLEFYRPAIGEFENKTAKERRWRRAVKKRVGKNFIKLSATKDNLQFIKKQFIPDLLFLMNKEPTFDTEKKEYTLEEWTLLHFELQAGKNRPQTIKSKKQHFYKHIYPELGKRLVSSIGYLDLQQWQSHMLKKINPKTGKEYKLYTVNTYRTVFFSILEDAVKADIITKNHFVSVPSPKTYTNLPKTQQADTINPFTKKEIALILTHSSGYLHNFIRLMLSSGIRPGELIALEWENIDFSRRVIIVNKTLNRKVENDPKTISSVREVDMLQEAKEALTDQLKLTKDKEKIFMSMFHKPFYSHDIITKLFKELLLKLNIPPRPLYNLRHTFASQAISNGVNILWVSRTLGHKDVSITLQVYAKFIVEDDKQRLENIKIIDKQFKGKI